jgi:hypothetical protein
VAIILPYEKDGSHQAGKFEFAGLHGYNIRFEGEQKHITMYFKVGQQPAIGDMVEYYHCIEDEKYHKYFTPEQKEKPTGGGGYRGSDSKHAAWATMYAIHLQIFIKEGMSFADARKAARAATNEVFKEMEV